MQISYFPPLDHAWLRMKGFLFQPFDLGRWFVVGFSAWLADLAGGSAGGGSEYLRLTQFWDGSPIRDWTWGGLDFLQGVFSNPWTLMVAGVLTMGALALGLAALWIGSRGRFMFLDHLVHARTAVKAPWTEFKNQGDSLFLWQVVYTVIVMVLLGFLLVGGMMLFYPVAFLGSPLALTIPLVVLAGTSIFVLVTALVFIEFFLSSFVVPIMYKHRVSATEAWRMFLPLFRAHPGNFVLYGLLYGGIMLAGALFYLSVGLLTCCFGLILLVIPYVGTVLTLPLHTLAAYLSLEFLAQFGDDFRLLPPLPDTPRHPYGSSQIQGHGAVVRPHDLGQDPGAQEAGPQDA